MSLRDEFLTAITREGQRRHGDDVNVSAIFQDAVEAYLASGTPNLTPLPEPVEPTSTGNDILDGLRAQMENDNR